MRAAADTSTDTVHFRLHVGGHVIRCVVTSELLCSVFHSEDTPAGWLACFEANQIAFVRKALRRYRTDGVAPVKLHSADWHSL